MVTELTSAGDRPFDGGRVPSTDTTDFTETSMGLSAKFLATESLDETTVTLTPGDTDDIDAFGVLEDLTNADFLLELRLDPVNFLSNGTSVNLDFHDVSLVLAEMELANLGGADHTNGRSVLLNALEITREVSLGSLILVLAVGVLGESLLFGLHPVSVESALDIGVEILGKDSGEGAETAGSLNVANESNDLHRRAFNDGDGVDDVLLDGLLTLASFLILHDVSHACLVAHEGGEVDGLGGIILGEGSNATTMVSSTSLGEVGQRTASGVFEFSVGHLLAFVFNND